MALRSFLIVFTRSVVLLGFLFVRFTHRFLQAVLWYLDGTARKLRDAKRSECYATSSQILDIRLFYSFDPMAPCSRNNFICTHNRFVGPRYIIDNDHVTLYRIDDEYAIFVEAQNKEMQLWKLEYSAFMTQAQLKYCDKMILVPLEHFHRMTEELPTLCMEKVVFMFNTGRCGSTLMVQVLENTDQCVSISEPGPLFTVFQKQLYKTDKAHVVELCKDLVRWICRPHNNFHPLIYFIKVNPGLVPIFPIVYDAFPRSKYLFMYRNFTDFVRSFCRSNNEFPLMLLLRPLTKISTLLRRKLLTVFGLPEGLRRNLPPWDDVVFGALIYTKNCHMYLGWRSEGLPIYAIRYEDLKSDPTYSITEIFRYCDLPNSLVESSLHGLSSDAQRNSQLSLEKLMNYQAPNLSPTVKSFANELFREHGLPLLGEDCILQGTITVPTK